MLFKLFLNDVWRTFLMNMEIMVLDTDKKQREKLCSLLEDQEYQVTPIQSLPKLEKNIRENACQAIILDIDSVKIDNQTIRKLALNNKGIHFLCLSRNRFHPNLKEALCYHIYACIKKPIDLDELLFWLKSINKECSA